MGFRVLVLGIECSESVVGSQLQGSTDYSVFILCGWCEGP